MLNMQNNFHSFKAKASNVARSLESICLCGLFFAMRLPKSWALHSGHMNGCTLTRYSQLAHRPRKASLEEWRDLCSACTSIPSTNPQTKGCPGTWATPLAPPQTATKAQTDCGLQALSFFSSHHPVSHPHYRGKATTLPTSCLQPGPAFLLPPFTRDFISAPLC